MVSDRERRASIAMVEGALEQGARNYFIDQCWKNVATIPHVVGITGACENIDTLFELSYFGRPAFLTQTGQLSLELLAPYARGVTTTIHSFRAEEEVDGRHLTEFPLVEFEFQYEGEGLSQLLDHIENTVKSMILSAILRESTALTALGVLIPELGHEATQPFERITYRDALKILEGVSFGDDLKADHEQSIVEQTGGPTFVTHYPEEIKFFNMRRCHNDPSIVESADLLLPYSGESVGSAVREHNPDVLTGKLLSSEMFRLHRERGGTFEDFAWYLNAVRENPVPHAGCGIGLSRITQYVLGKADIRESTAYVMNRETDLNRL